ncbi:serine homologous recombinase [Microbacterium phage Floof]|uniref:Serine homologous recombinase n=1 Tax=Microbacterium phage Floof TaxID=2201433 RepID=A0A2Z4Q4R4_9CAUD|nr:serine homologous recombinase [Microbacterium phage Floof]
MTYPFNMDQDLAKPTRRPRAVLYSRLSRASIVSTSMEGQREDLHGLAAREGWDVVAAFDDEGKSGGRKRANAEEALRMIRDGEADILAAYSVDRFSRQGIGEDAEVIRIIQAREHAARRGDGPPALAYFVREGIRSDSGDDWRLRYALSSEMAWKERELMVQRRQRSIYQLQEQGRFSGRGPAPWGYRSAPHPSGAGRTLVLDETEAHDIREAAARLISGASATSVATDMTARGVPAPRSPYRLALLKGEDPTGLATGFWGIGNLIQALTSPSITGRIVRHSRQTNALGGETRAGTPVLDAEGKPLQAFPPALPLGDWLALQERFQRGQGRGQQRTRKAARLASGLVWCQCGEKCYVIKYGRETRYRCASRSKGMIHCPAPSMSADVVEDIITQHYLATVGKLPAIERIESDDAPELAEALALAADELRRLTADMTKPGADIMTLATEVAKASARRDELLARPSERHVSWRPLGGSWADVWQTSDLETRRRQLTEAYDHWELRTPEHEPRLVPRTAE